MLKNIINKINNIPVEKIIADNQFNELWEDALKQKTKEVEVNNKKTEIVINKKEINKNILFIKK